MPLKQARNELLKSIKKSAHLRKLIHLLYFIKLTDSPAEACRLASLVG